MQHDARTLSNPVAARYIQVMTEKSKPAASPKPPPATAYPATTALQALACEFLDLWQANLMAWAGDPTLPVQMQQMLAVQMAANITPAPPAESAN